MGLLYGITEGQIITDLDIRLVRFDLFSRSNIYKYIVLNMSAKHSGQPGGHDLKFYFPNLNIGMNTSMLGLSCPKNRFSKTKLNPRKAHHSKICS